MDKLKIFARTLPFQIRFIDQYLLENKSNLLKNFKPMSFFFFKKNLVKQRRPLETQKHE